LDKISTPMEGGTEVSSCAKEGDEKKTLFAPIQDMKGEDPAQSSKKKKSSQKEDLRDDTAIPEP